MKYKVGDKVRIKPKEWYDENKNERGAISEDESFYSFVEPMGKYLGMEATITEVKGLAYSIDLDRNRNYWYDWMFEDEQSEQTLFDRIKSAITEAAKEANILVEPTEDGGIKISPLEENDNDLKIGTPCMVSDDGNEWGFSFYAGNKRTFSDGFKWNKSSNTFTWLYIIEFSKFNPNNIEESIKYNIVK